MTMPRSLRERFLGDERGFTLTEVLTTTIIMMFVLLALAGLFDTGLKVFSFGNNKVEAVESARIGLQKMEREIRQAYEFDHTVSVPKDYIFFTTAGGTTTPLALPAVPPTPQVVNQLTFGDDLGGPPDFGNDKIECGSPCEYITYKLTDGASDIDPSDINPPLCTTASVTCTLRRVNTSDSTQAGDPVVENVAPPIEDDPATAADESDPNRGLSFTLLKSDGGIPASEGEIGMVVIKLKISVNKGIGHAGTQTLTTVVHLRNRP